MKNLNSGCMVKMMNDELAPFETYGEAMSRLIANFGVAVESATQAIANLAAVANNVFEEFFEGQWLYTTEDM